MLKLNTSRGEGFIGIWWFVDNEIWGVRTSLEKAYLSGRYYQYSDTENHLSLWEKVKSIFDKYGSYKSLGYKAVERGRVLFDTMTQVYVVTCSAELVGNKDFQEAVIDFYDLKGNRVEFEALTHYHVYREGGNKALEQFLVDC